MKKDNMLYFLEAQLEKKFGDYDFAIDWNTKNHTVEVIGVIYAQNQTDQAIEDTEGVHSEEEVIEFEDSLVLYNPDKFTPNEEDYLAMVPYEGKKGIQKRVLVAVATYFKDVLTEGESDLLDFLGDEEAEVFELKWDNAAFEKVLSEVTGLTDYTAYPKY